MLQHARASDDEDPKLVRVLLTYATAGVADNTVAALKETYGISTRLHDSSPMAPAIQIARGSACAYLQRDYGKEVWSKLLRERDS